MSLIPEEFMLLAFNGCKDSAEAGEAFLKLLQEVGTEIWDSDKLKEPERYRVYIALRDIEPSYSAFVEAFQHLPFDHEIKERLHFRLVKLMDDLAVVGGQSVLTRHGRKFAQGLQGREAGNVHATNAQAKNSKMWPHIEAEAAEQGRKLVDSDECGRELENGVRKRMGVGKEAKGFSFSTIRKQIRFILKERRQA